MNTELSRVHALIDADGTTRLAQYSYLGLDQFVRDEYPQAGVELTYLKQGSETNGPQGDQYNGLDYFGRVVDQRWINASTIADVERVKYGFDPNGNRLWRENTVAHAAAKKQDELYTYDGLNQLTVLQRGDLNSGHTAITGTPTWEEDFTLDPTGNWNDYVTKVNTSADLTQARTHNEANELTKIDNAATCVAEGAAGNMTKVPQPGVWNAAYDLKYDAWNRLVKVMDGANTVAVYAYDGLTRRTTKTIGSETRHYYYSDQWQILEEHLTNGSGTTVDRQFVWGQRYIDDLVLRDRSVSGTLDERLYTLHDYFHPTAITNTSGAVQERYGYDAYGTSRVMDAAFAIRTTSSFDWETRYAAYRWDGETGLYQVRYRYLHPGLGRWVTRDPIGESGGLNMYEYASNIPIGLVDPLGLVDGDFKSKAIENALNAIGSKSTFNDLEPVKGTDYKYDPDKKLYLRYDTDKSHSDPHVHFFDSLKDAKKNKARYKIFLDKAKGCVKLFSFVSIGITITGSLNAIAENPNFREALEAAIAGDKAGVDEALSELSVDLSIQSGSTLPFLIYHSTKK